LLNILLGYIQWTEFTIEINVTWPTAMRLRSQRPLHVQGYPGHPGQQGGGPEYDWNRLKV
jgi:hypothetical protein